VSRPVILSLYALLLVIWSSTWVAIKFGLEDTPALLGAGIRFFVAGAGLLVIAAATRRSLKTDRVLAGILAVLPFAISYGLVYWAERYIPSGLTAVLFGMMPIYVAILAGLMLEDEPVHPRLFAGLAIAVAGLALAFSESLDLGSEDRAALGAAAALIAPFCAAVGNVAIKRRGAGLDAIVLNGWAMGIGGLLLLAGSALTESWGDAEWNGKSVGAIAYLAILGSAVGFVVLTRLLGELTAVSMSYIPLIIPFGALLWGWGLYDEALTGTAVLGAALVAGGLLVTQWRGRRRRAAVPAPLPEGGTGA
jgi:drug/metabolite transporter (DMT)-like permease